MTKLNKVTEGHNRFCGPAVLSIVTGKSTDECAEAIRKINGNYKIEGVFLFHLIAAADKLGFKCEETPFIGNSLYSALTSISRNDGIYIVTISNGVGHYVCVEIADRKIYFCDNHTKEPIPAASSARLMNGVASIHKVLMKPKPQLLPERIREVIYYECEYCGWIVSNRANMSHYSVCEYQIAKDANK